MKIMFRYRKKNKWGIALFVLMTSIAILSLLMRELLTTSSNQAIRVRNFGDRIEALYMAKSSLNLARFILMIDRFIDSQKRGQGLPVYDRLDDLWTTPNNFPLAPEEVQALMSGALSGSKDQGSTKNKSDKAQPPTEDRLDTIKKCKDFFDDFPGTATSITTDLSSRIFLNDTRTPVGQGTFEILTELLRPNVDFIQHLNERGIQPETIAREIRDYSDDDMIENETNAPESSPYSAMQLDYGPKNRVYTNLDELKLIPHMDDFIFDYLSELVNPYNIPASMMTPPAKINLNTVSKSVFQALLKNVADPEAVAEKFIKDRDENQRTYTDKEIQNILNDALQLTSDNIRLNLLTGVSNSFKIDTTVNLNNIAFKLESVVVRANGNRKVDPIVLMRISP